MLLPHNPQAPMCPLKRGNSNSGSNATERETTILRAFMKAQVITQKEAYEYKDIHDRLGVSGLMT